MGTNGQGLLGDSPRIALLRARLEHAQAEREEAERGWTSEDRAEAELRSQIAKEESERDEQARAKRELDLERRLDVAKEANGPSVKLAAVMIRKYDDTFIIAHQPKAHAKFQADVTAIVSGNRKLDRDEVYRNYAAACVIDWNGITDYGPTSLNGRALIVFLKEHPGIVSTLVNAVSELAGSYAEDRKSG